MSHTKSRYDQGATAEAGAIREQVASKLLLIVIFIAATSWISYQQAAYTLLKLRNMSYYGILMPPQNLCTSNNDVPVEFVMSA